MALVNQGWFLATWRRHYDIAPIAGVVSMNGAWSSVDGYTMYVTLKFKALATWWDRRLNNSNNSR